MVSGFSNNYGSKIANQPCIHANRVSKQTATDAPWIFALESKAADE